jgi:hypothetical protein
MRKTLIALMFAAALPTVAMAMPEGGPMGGPMAARHGGQMHGARQRPVQPTRPEPRTAPADRQADGRADARASQLVEKYLENSRRRPESHEGRNGRQPQESRSRRPRLLKPDQQKKFDEIQKQQAERRAEWAEFQAWKAQQPQKRNNAYPVARPVPICGPGFSCLRIFCAFIVLAHPGQLLAGHRSGCRAVDPARAHAQPGRLDSQPPSRPQHLAAEWTQTYEAQGEDAAQDILEQRKRQYHIDVQVLNESGDPVVRGTFPRRAAAFEARQNNDDRRLPWRA